jgi:hypothetical protein
MDGFFLTGRAADAAFTWDKLKGKRVLVDHGGQPLAMFKYACHKRGLDFKAITAVDLPSAAFSPQIMLRLPLLPQVKRNPTLRSDGQSIAICPTPATRTAWRSGPPRRWP